MKKKITKSFREQLGIPQAQMADFLGVHRVVLSDYERGRRQLPNAASIKLNNLELLHLQLQQKKAAAKPADDKAGKAKTAAHLKTHLKQLQVKTLRLEQKLDKIKELQATYNNLEKLMTAVLNDKTTVSDDKIWADMFVRLANKKANTNGVHAQALLQLKLDALQYHTVQATKLLKENSL